MSAYTCKYSKVVYLYYAAQPHRGTTDHGHVSYKLVVELSIVLLEIIE